MAGLTQAARRRRRRRAALRPGSRAAKSRCGWTRWSSAWGCDWPRRMRKPVNPQARAEAEVDVPGRRRSARRKPAAGSSFLSSGITTSTPIGTSIFRSEPSGGRPVRFEGLLPGGWFRKSYTEALKIDQGRFQLLIRSPAGLHRTVRSAMTAAAASARAGGSIRHLPSALCGPDLGGCPVSVFDHRVAEVLGEAREMAGRCRSRNPNSGCSANSSVLAVTTAGDSAETAEAEHFPCCRRTRISACSWQGGSRSSAEPSSCSLQESFAGLPGPAVSTAPVTAASCRCEGCHTDPQSDNKCAGAAQSTSARSTPGF